MQKLENAQLQKAFRSELGFFGQIYYLDSRKVLKRYSGSMSREESDKMLGFHRDYIKNLKKVGIHIPKTVAAVEHSPRGFKFWIVQDRFEPDELAGEIIKKGSKEDVLNVAEGILRDALLFIRSPFFGKMGFHPTVRNYAVCGGIFYMIDTFPPYGTEDETIRMAYRHAPNKKAKISMSIFYPFLKKFFKDCYDQVEMLYGIYGTVSRLRPEYEKDVRELLFSLIDKETASWKKDLLKKIQKRGARQMSKWILSRRFYRN